MRRGKEKREKGKRKGRRKVLKARFLVTTGEAYVARGIIQPLFI
jgi:hypothetical protein